MLRNYLKIAFRNLQKNKIFSIINILGLAIGITICLLITVYVFYECSYDRFNEHYTTLYRVVQHQNQNGTWYEIGRTPANLAAALKTSFPEVKNSTRFLLGSGSLLTYRTHTNDEPNRILAETSLFEMFTFPFIQGNPKQALESPNSIILSETLARKYFGTTNPMGQTMLIDQKIPMRVTGVFRDIPVNSHLQFDYVLPLSYAKAQGANLDEWGSNSFYTYLQLHHPSQQATADLKLKPYPEKTFKNKEEQFYLQPLSEIHLYSRFDFNTDFGKRGDIRYVRFFSILAFLVLLLGCLNFTNLATAQALTRVKEVGLRKTVGAKRHQVVTQFMSESFLVTTLASLLALGFASVCLPFLSSFIEKPLSLPITKQVFWLTLVGISIVTSLLSGSYPAFVLSSFRPTQILCSPHIPSLPGITLGRVLVVGQFTLSISMIVAAVLMYKQLKYVSERKLGIQIDNVVYVELRGDLAKNLSVVKTKLMQQPEIENVTATGYYSMPFKWVGSSGTGGVRVGGQAVIESFNLHDFRIDYGFVETMGLTLSQGRSFSPSFRRDTSNFILNEAAIHRLGLKKPLGTLLDFYGTKGMIVGIVHDFHFATLKSKVEPALLRIDPTNAAYLLIRIKPHKSSQILATINTIAGKYAYGHPVEARFLQVDYQNLYQQEQVTGILFGWFTSFTIFISCLGLFGLSALLIERRTKEIGVRKVLGASVSQIAALLSIDFIKLVLIAFIISVPIAWYIMRQWFQNFAYRIEITWWVFVLAGVVALLIVLLTVSFQAIKAAVANPVKSLRSE